MLLGADDAAGVDAAGALAGAARATVDAIASPNPATANMTTRSRYIAFMGKPSFRRPPAQWINDIGPSPGAPRVPERAAFNPNCNSDLSVKFDCIWAPGAALSGLRRLGEGKVNAGGNGSASGVLSKS
jgi:hypothetical protein